MKIYTNEEIKKKLNRKNKRKKVIDFIIYPIVSFILVCCIIVVLQAVKNPGQTPNLFGYKFFNVISGSMKPNLDIGDVVITKEIEVINKGDIITFKQQDSIVTHRVVDIINENEKIYYQTKGDNNNSNDEILVENKDIEGVCVWIIPKIGMVINNIQNTTSMILIILVLYLIYKILQIKDDRKIARHEKRKELENK